MIKYILFHYVSCFGQKTATKFSIGHESSVVSEVKLGSLSLVDISFYDLA